MFKRICSSLQVWIRVEVNLLWLGSRFYLWEFHSQIKMRYTYSSSMFRVTPNNQWPEPNIFTPLKFKTHFLSFFNNPFSNVMPPALILLRGTHVIIIKLAPFILILQVRNGGQEWLRGLSKVTCVENEVVYEPTLSRSQY